jgi:hypothetical protein
MQDRCRTDSVPMQNWCKTDPGPVQDTRADESQVKLVTRDLSLTLLMEVCNGPTSHITSGVTISMEMPLQEENPRPMERGEGQA